MNEADTCRTLVRPKLEAAGWEATGEQRFYTEQTAITDGRVTIVAGTPRRQDLKKPDFLLHFRKDVRLAVVEAKAIHRPAADGMQQAKQYAAMLGLHFAYATNGTDILEYDAFTGLETDRPAFPTPDELWRRYQVGLALSGAQSNALLVPDYPHPGKALRYYQRTAVDAAVRELVGGRKRALLTLATGTGKTAVAFQICWKLWSSKWNTAADPARRPRILFLADRNKLVDDPRDRHFAPFGDARHKIAGKPVR